MISRGQWRFLSLVLASIALVAAADENPHPGQSGLLTTLVEAAWRYNPGITALEEDLHAGESRIVQARAQLLPNASLNASYASNQASAAVAGAEDENYRYASVQASLRVPLFKPKASQALESSRLDMRGLELALHQAQNDLAVSVIENVFQHIVLREEIHALEQQIHNLETQVLINSRRLEGGVGSRTEVVETRLRLHLSQTQLDTRRSELQRLGIELSRLLGPQTFELSAIAIKPKPITIAPKDLNTARDTLLKSNISLLRANNKIELAHTNRRLQDRGHWPTLDLIASRNNSHYAGSHQSSSENDWSNSLTLEFELPLYAGGGVNAQQKEASALWLKAQQELQTNQQSAIAELQQQFEARDLHLQRIETNEAAMSQARELLEMTRKAFDAGNRSNIDLLNAQQQVTDIGSDLIKSRVDHLTVQARIMALLGKMNIDTLTRLDSCITALY